MRVRLLLSLVFLPTLIGRTAFGAQPAAAEGFTHQPGFTGECGHQPGGLVCLEFADGYTWPVQDTITGWGRNHGDIQIAYGVNANYAHVLGTDLVWVPAAN